MYTEPVVIHSPLRVFMKTSLMAVITALAGWGAHHFGLATTPLAIISVCTFIAVICATLIFWTQRVAIALLGMAVLIGSGAMTLEGMLQSTELDIIFFLIGMMVIVGALKDLGVLTWIIQVILNKKHMTGTSFTVILCGLSALLSCAVGEVSSIVIILALVFQVCDTLKVRPAPFVLIAILCTNIGSTATMLGNPVGILIGNKAGFTFNQFLIGALPTALAALFATLLIVLVWYRKSISQMTELIRERRKVHHGLGPLFRIPHRRGLFVLIATVGIIAFHNQIELFLGLTGAENTNAFLIITPLIIAGLLMLYRSRRARHYIERDVEWWTLLFFMLLFAIAGGLEEQGVTRNMADKLIALARGDAVEMLPFVLVFSSIGAAFVDSIVFVAAFTPVVQSLVERSAEYSILWWALLFSACFGSNITVVGSTANIIALGMLEKRGRQHIPFFEWLGIGLFVGIVTGAIAWAMLTWMPPPPLPANKPRAAIEKHAAPAPTPAPTAADGE